MRPRTQAAEVQGERFGILFVTRHLDRAQILLLREQPASAG
jgi:hypothetical protein